MGTHPNVLLIAVLTPDNTSRKTLRDILKYHNINIEDDCIGDIDIDGNDFTYKVMEDTYEENYQISAKEGDLIFHDFLTYGYGDYITWPQIILRQSKLDSWCKNICEKFKCNYEIRIAANYW